MMVVALEASQLLSVGTPELLFTGEFVEENATEGVNNYDVAPDGQRFLMIGPPTSESADPQINIVVTWFEELKERVPVT